MSPASRHGPSTGCWQAPCAHQLLVKVENGSAGPIGVQAPVRLAEALRSHQDLGMSAGIGVTRAVQNFSPSSTGEVVGNLLPVLSKETLL